MQVWEAFNGNVLYVHKDQNRIFAAPWSPDGSRIASGSFDATVQVLDALSGNSLLSYHAHCDPVYAVAWSSDNSRLVSAGQDTSVHVWSPVTGETRLIYSGHKRPVKSLSLSPDGCYIVSGGDDASMQVWSTRTGEQISMHMHSTWVRSVSWSPVSTLIASASGRNVYLWVV
jgi:WD40 repeat protein